MLLWCRMRAALDSMCASLRLAVSSWPRKIASPWFSIAPDAAVVPYKKNTCRVAGRSDRPFVGRAPHLLVLSSAKMIAQLSPPPKPTTLLTGLLARLYACMHTTKRLRRQARRGSTPRLCFAPAVKATNRPQTDLRPFFLT